MNEETLLVIVLFFGTLIIVASYFILPRSDETNQDVIEEYCEINTPLNHKWVGNNFGCYKLGSCRYVSDENVTCFISWECRDGGQIWEHDYNYTNHYDWDGYYYGNMEHCI